MSDARDSSPRLTVGRDVLTGVVRVSGDVELEAITRQLQPHFITDLMQRIADRLAEEYVKEHGQEVLARIDLQAVANLLAVRAAGGMEAVFGGKK